MKKRVSLCASRAVIELVYKQTSTEEVPVSTPVHALGLQLKPQLLLREPAVESFAPDAQKGQATAQPTWLEMHNESPRGRPRPPHRRRVERRSDDCLRPGHSLEQESVP